MELISLSPRCRSNSARCVRQPQLAGARIAKPHEDVRRIRPKERTDFSRNLHSLIDAQSLQSLNIENAVIKFAIGPFVPVNTLPLAISLSRHMTHQIPRAGEARNINR